MIWKWMSRIVPLKHVDVIILIRRIRAEQPVYLLLSVAFYMHLCEKMYHSKQRLEWWEIYQFHLNRFVFRMLKSYRILLDNQTHPKAYMMTLSKGKFFLFRVTGPLWGESTGHWWIPHTKASDAELWCLLWFAPEQTVDQTIETPVIWVALFLILTSLLWLSWGQNDVHCTVAVLLCHVHAKCKN